jgi:hypothetical protein
MPTDAPHEANAVRSMHSLGLMEGVAEARTLADFPIFADRAGYSGLSIPEPEYPAAYAAASDLMQQASGPRKSRQELIADATRGPAVMHFDQLADGVLRNRLHDVVPDRAEDRRAVRAALIGPMMHQGWMVLKDHRDVGIGRAVANDIRRALDAKVDEIKHHYQAQPAQAFPADGPNAEAAQALESKTLADIRAEDNKLDGLPPPDPQTRVHRPDPGPQDGQANELRFLDGQAPAAGAVRAQAGVGEGRTWFRHSWADDVASGAARPGLVAAGVRTLAFQR